MTEVDMLKVFLCEDEIVMREGIKKNIDWESEDLSFVGEAGDGELAFPLIKETAPDILITDIRMPFMDGLELSKLVKKEFPQIKIIILSGYDEFEYAKEAIEIGITEYLVKPITAAKLLKEVKKVADMIRSERAVEEEGKSYQLDRKEELIMEHRALFRELVNGKSDMPTILKKGEALGLDLAAGSYSILLFMTRPVIEEGSGITETYSESEVAITERVQERFVGDNSVQIYEQLGRVLAILLLAPNTREMEKKQEEVLKTLKGITAEYPDVMYFGAVGETVQRIREVYLSYEDANRKFAHRFLSDKSSVYAEAGGGEDEKGEGKNPIDLAELDVGKLDRRMIESFLRSGKLSEIDDFVSEFLESLGKENIESVLFRQYVAMDVYFAIVSFLESLGTPKEEIGGICGNFRDGAKALSDADSTRGYLNEILTAAITQRNQVSDRRY
ncbi:MAG: response regulator, partial [Lachnospiraceae bacterium]|nr:response regulator [Lachnospiraceae bacterium]